MYYLYSFFSSVSLIIRELLGCCSSHNRKYIQAQQFLSEPAENWSQSDQAALTSMLTLLTFLWALGYSPSVSTYLSRHLLCSADEYKTPGLIQMTKWSRVEGYEKWPCSIVGLHVLLPPNGAALDAVCQSSSKWKEQVSHPSAWSVFN